MVHRVDGPIGVYRGFDDGTDRRIVEVNGAFAAATILQSHYSLEKHRELGFELRNPVVIRNAVASSIFHPPTTREPLSGRRVRVIARGDPSLNVINGMMWASPDVLLVASLGQTRGQGDLLPRLSVLDVAHRIVGSLRALDQKLARFGYLVRVAGNLDLVTGF